VFHVQISQLPHSARAFNLHRDTLFTTVVEPWLRGDTIELGDRTWNPAKAELTVYEGRELRPDELGMGRGWSNAVRAGDDVTARVIDEARRQAEPPRAQASALERFKEEVLEQCGAGRIGIHQVMWLASAEFPGSRASERLALAEQSVWELLHQHRLRMLIDGDPVPAEEWERIVLRWETWAGGPGAATVLLEASRGERRW
jgi:hypothetical protein